MKTVLLFPGALRRFTAALAMAAFITALTAPALRADPGSDPLKERAEEGRSFGLSVVGETPAATLSDDEVLKIFPGSGEARDVPLSELFPAYGGAGAADPRVFYGAEGNLGAASSDAASKLDNSSSAQGEAWRVMTGTRDRSGVDLGNDPVFDSTKAILGTLEKLEGDFSSCEADTEWVPRSLATVSTTEHICTRAASAALPALKLRHELDIRAGIQRFTANLPVHTRKVTVAFDEGRIRTHQQWTETVHVYGEYHDYSYTVTKNSVKTSTFPPLDRDQFCGPDARTAIKMVEGAVKAPHGGVNIRSVRQPDCTGADMVWEGAVSGNSCYQVYNNGGRESENGWWETKCDPSGLFLTVHTTTIEKDRWKRKSVMDELADIRAGSCEPKLRQVSGSDGEEGSCIETGGGEICPGDELWARIKPPPFDPAEAEINRLALSVEVDISSCEPQDAVEESCEEYASNPLCSYRTTFPVTAEGAAPTLYEDVYDCREESETETVALQGNLICPGPVRGLGDDLVRPVEESNESFAEVASRLAAAKFIAMDSACGDPDNPAVDPRKCRVFKGEAAKCKKAVFGIVDCCEDPGGISLAQYLQLAFAIGKLDGAIGYLDQTSPIVGAWEYATAPFSEAWSVVSRNFASGVNSITGTTVINVSDAAQKGIVTVVQNQLLQKTAQWTAQVFGEAAANTLFQSAAEGGGQAFVNGVMAEAGVMLGPELLGLYTMMSYVMLAYTIYNMTMLLAQIIWKCTMDELNMAVKRELKACHYVGTYCSSSSFGVCLTRKRSYCCFSSPLSRIMQEQIRGQKGVGFGPTKNPDCSGFAIEELDEVDFSKIDLSEWTEILLKEGVMPGDTEATLEAMTGEGNAITSSMPAGVPREDTLDRTLGRLENFDIEGTHDAARRQLEGAANQ